MSPLLSWEHDLQGQLCVYQPVSQVLSGLLAWIFLENEHQAVIKAQIEHRYFSRRDPKMGCENSVPFLNKLNKECSLRGLGKHVSGTRDTLNLRMSGSH